MAITKVTRTLLSTGIVDNSNATAITIGSDESVTFAAGITSTQPNAFGACSFNEADLTNVGTVFADQYLGDADTNTGIVLNGSDVMTLHTAGTERMRIDSSGNVGIGTSSPTEKLTVNGALAITGALADDRTSTAAMDFSGGVTRFISYGASGTGGIFAFRTASGGASSTERMRITADGTMGFGMSPLGTNNGSAFFDGNVSSKDGFMTTATNLQFLAPSGGSSNTIFLRDNGNESMRIASNGRTSIGTTTTNAGLTVANGDIRCTAAAVANDANSISMSQESVGGVIAARGPGGSTKGTISLSVNEDDGGNGIVGLKVENTGNVTIAGALSKGSGSFKIDHPLESKKDTHHLVHSFVEAPQADNIYRGKVDLVDGSATVNIDTVAGMTEGTYVLLNTNTSCFTSNETDWDAVKGSVSGNILTISCQNSSSTATVSWLVIGERHDQHMIDTEWTDENGKVIVEPTK